MAESSKKCTRCGKEKPPSEFWTRRALKSGLMSACKSCSAAAQGAWYRANAVAVAEYRGTEEYKRMQREKALRRLYGISVREYEEMYEAQGGECAICSSWRQPWRPGLPKGLALGKLLVVDHNHASGEVRALLCDACNKGLGAFRDNAVLLRGAANYLDSFP